MSERLRQHYEEKYANAPVVASVARLTSTPRNRFEGAVNVLRQEFRGGSILEIGSGDGIIARSAVAAEIPFDRFVMTDLSQARADYAAASINDPRVTGFALDIESGADAFGEEKFDAVVMIALIEHLIDPIGAMRNIRALLRPGGFAYIDTPNIAKYTRRLKLLAGRFPSTASQDEGLRTYGGGAVDLYDEGHLHYWTYRSMREMLIRYCGFTEVSFRPYAPGGTPPVAARLWPEMFSDVAVVAR